MACAIGWRPADFWDATPHEFFQGLDGHGLAQGDEAALADDRGDRFQDFLAAMEAAGY